MTDRPYIDVPSRVFTDNPSDAGLYYRESESVARLANYLNNSRNSFHGQPRFIPKHPPDCYCEEHHLNQ